MPDLYLVEGLNWIRRGEEFAVKKKTFTSKDFLSAGDAIDCNGAA